MTAKEAISMHNVTVRLAGPADESGLARLAALDSADPLRGPVLVAEAESRLIAALPLGAGRPIADPFEPTAELVALLEMRRVQLTDRSEGRLAHGRLRALLRGRLTHARA
jgi:hypothetical protein